MSLMKKFKLVSPTIGAMRVQEANKVPTMHGTIKCEPGDWLVVLRDGILVCIPDEIFRDEFVEPTSSKAKAMFEKDL